MDKLVEIVKAYGGLEGGGEVWLLNFSETNYHIQCPVSTVAVRISLTHIWTQDF